MRNVHQRELPVPAGVVGPYLDRLGSPEDVLWPAPAWPPMRLDQPLRVGSAGGHDDVRYAVSGYEPGRRVGFTFDPSTGLHGRHALEVYPLGPERCLLRHEMDGRLTGRARVLWPLAVRWMHDAVLEDLLNNTERAVTGTVRTPYRWSPWVRLLRRSGGPRVRAVPFPADSRTAGAVRRIDYADAFQLRLPVGVSADAERWAAVAFSWPADMDILQRGRAETVGGGDTRVFDYRAGLLVTADERRVTVTIASVVEWHNQLGRVCFALIRPCHRVAARVVLRRAADRMLRATRNPVAVQ